MPGNLDSHRLIRACAHGNTSFVLWATDEYGAAAVAAARAHYIPFMHTQLPEWTCLISAAKFGRANVVKILLDAATADVVSGSAGDAAGAAVGVGAAAAAAAAATAAATAAAAAAAANWLH